MKLWQFLQDGDGAFSSNRLVYLGWSMVLLIMVSYLTFKNGEFPKIESSLVLLYGTVVTGKIVQSFSENNTGTSTKQVSS